MENQTGKNIGYIRVSSLDQNLGRQLEDISKKLDKTFEDKASGKDTNRPGLKACLEYLREGDTLHVHSIDRLARNLIDLQKIVSELNAKGISIVFHKENLKFICGEANNSMQKFMLHMLGAVAEFERSIIRERQREGIALAKKNGRKLGRGTAVDAEQIEQIRRELEQGKSAALIAKERGLCRQTVYNYAKEIKSEAVPMRPKMPKQAASA